MFDLIGDIHGHADKLEALLKKMGYEKRNKSYSALTTFYAFGQSDE